MVNDCAWLESFEFQPATKEWLMGLDWPDPAYEDLNRLADQQQDIRDNCEADIESR